uniref:Condensin-1 complex subunit CAP-D2 n=1 Tax=Anthurium amnicola TaxID=1678845 RepID=A0A1D1Y9V6_9ARAE
MASPPAFVFPAALRDLEEEPDGDDRRLHVVTLSEVSSLRPAELEELVKGVAFDLSDKEIFCVEEQGVFDRLYSLVKGFPRLPTACKSLLLETLRSNLSVLLPSIGSLSRTSSSSSSYPHVAAGAPSPRSSPSPPPSNGGYGGGQPSLAQRIASLRNALKIYTFFLLTIVLSEESASSGQEAADAGGGGSSKVAMHGRKKNTAALAWNWGPQRGRVVSVIANSLEINLQLLFGPTDPDEKYLLFVSKCAFSMFENPVLLRDEDTRNSLCRIIGSVSTKHHQTAQSCASILNLMYRFDFTVTHLASAVAASEKKYGDGSLAVALIREIGRTDPKDYVRDAAGAENVGRFLVELADLSPKVMSTNVGILVPHFGGDSYKIRNALVGVFGKLVLKAFKDIDGDVSSKSLRLRGKQAMLDILLERCRDVSAYTRSRVLQVWAELCAERAVSIGLWNELASVASGRLEDKSAMVRKSALNLLITMLQYNPFGPQLRIAAFEATLEKYKDKLSQMEPNVLSEMVTDGNVVPGEAVVEGQHETVPDSLPFSEAGAKEDTTMPDVGNLEQTRALVASLEAGLRFSQCVSSTMKTLVQLMASATVTDVENTILLLMRCEEFQIDGSEACLCKMLPLVFSQDKSIYEAVEHAFITIYIRKSPSETASNLLNLAVDSNIGDLAALEFMIGSLVSKGDISMSTISALWDFFSFNINGVTAVQCRGALSVLCMAAKSSPGILSSHLQDIIDIGFGRWAKEEPLLARTACVALERLSREDKEKLINISGGRVFGLLQGLITGFMLPENIWYAAADRAISALYSIHPTPEILAADLVKTSLNSLFCCSGSNEEPNNVDCANSTLFVSVPLSKLSRCLFIISHMALHQLVYIESCVRKLQKQKANREKSKVENDNFQGGCIIPTEANAEGGINAELGLASSEDMMIDGLSEKAEKEIISGGCNEKNLIGICAPFISKLCRNYNLMQKYPELQASAMLALCRLMIIDANFCEANLQLLFTVVESAPSETVRSNCTVALGDLVARFPNLLEPWTENVYARLRDPSISVRKNAILVLSHLLLNDMMKVKGHINEMATRLEDDDERISCLAKLFFHELSKKGSNPIYNLLPDILSRLSNQNLKTEQFHSIMQFLINSIKKDKQMEALVEKLCNRFSGVSDVRQWEYIAYCLSQLAFTERGFKKLMDSMKTYEHALCEDSVIDHFRNIISKGKKFAKIELKSCIEEFEGKLNNIHAERKEQEMVTRNAQEYKQQIGSIKGSVASNEGVEDGANDVDDGAMDVIETNEDKTKLASNSPNASGVRSEESCISSVAIESEVDSVEVQSPKTSHNGLSRLRARKVKGLSKKVQLGSDSLCRKSRSSRR